MNLDLRQSRSTYDTLPETELSAENLLTGVFGSFLTDGIIQLRSVSKSFKQAYFDVQPMIRRTADAYDLLPKKELTQNTDGDFGFARGIEEARIRGLVIPSTCKTVLDLQPTGLLFTVNFWGSLPGPRDLYETVADGIKERYTSYFRQ